MRPWRTLQERRLTGPSGFLRLVTRTYELPDGRRSDWDLLDGGETVAVLALTVHDEVILAGSSGPDRGRFSTRCPAGR